MPLLDNRVGVILVSSVCPLQKRGPNDDARVDVDVVTYHAPTSRRRLVVTSIRLVWSNSHDCRA